MFYFEDMIQLSNLSLMFFQMIHGPIGVFLWLEVIYVFNLNF